MASLTNAHPPLAPPPRLRLDPERAHHTQLDGCWWPGSTDPSVELPGLVRALEDSRGPVVRLQLSAAGWSRRPHGLDLAGRAISLGYFSEQPATQLTAALADGGCVNLQVVPSEISGDDRPR
jgi:hypothetical protein